MKKIKYYKNKYGKYVFDVFCFILLLFSAANFMLVEKELNYYYLNYQLHNDDLTFIGGEYYNINIEIINHDYKQLTIFEYHRIMGKYILSAIGFSSFLILLITNNKSNVK